MRRLPREIGDLDREQKRRLREAQARRDEQFGEEGVTGAIAILATGPLYTIGHETPQPDITKYAIVFE